MEDSTLQIKRFNDALNEHHRACTLLERSIEGGKLCLKRMKQRKKIKENG